MNMQNEIQELTRLDLNLLVLFAAVMDERHVGRAATRMNLTPSAISHGLGRLRAMIDDPLFLKTPKGVVPTDRALALAPQISDILARTHGIVAGTKPFDPATSDRRFVIGAPDGISSVFLPPLLNAVRRDAPRISVAIRQLLPSQGQTSILPVWQPALTDLETRAIDVAVIPFKDLPARFHVAKIYEEEFVIAARSDHPFVRKPSLERYCATDHLVVSHNGDPSGFVDAVLAEQQLSRRVTLTVPNFHFALATLANMQLLSALPRHFVEQHGAQFGVVAIRPPLTLPRFTINLILPKVALMDTGLAWFVRTLESLDLASPPPRPSARQKSKKS